MDTKTKKENPRNSKNADVTQNYNAYHREYMQKKGEEKRDIGELPPVKNPERKNACEKDLILFCNTYLKEYFFREWSDAQKNIAGYVQKVIENGGSQAIAHKRRGAKTTICLGGLLWAVIYGKHMYSFFVAAESGASLAAKDFFEHELMNNDLIAEDFPEICMPIIKWGGVRNRNVAYHGQFCHLSFSGNEVVLPTMRIYKNGEPVKNKNGKPKHYPASGALIKFVSVSSTGIRGRQHILADRGNVRPSLALIDDPQNDGAAKSEHQINILDDFVRKTIAPMSGYDKTTGKIKSPSILMTVTCIQPNDFAVQYTDRKLNPDYNGLLYRRFPKMPNPIPPVWHQYREMWKQDGGSRSKPCLERKATQFYLENRKIMDRGFEVDDANDYEQYQISAIQYGMDIWCENEKGFWCEHQNDPEAAQASMEKGLTPKFITREKSIRFAEDQKRLSFRRWIPENTYFLAGFIDTGMHYLNYEIKAFGKGFSFSHVVDFGYFPDQKGWHEIRKDNYNVDMQKFYRQGSTEEKISQGITDCLKHIFSQEYYDHNGRPVDIHQHIDLTFGREEQKARFLAMVGVDARDRDQEESVWTGIAQFNDESREEFPVINRAMPCYGEPTPSRHIRNFDLKTGEWQRGRERFKAGDGDWIEYPITKKHLIEKYQGRVASCLLWEANTYRSLRNKAWLTEKGTNGCQTIFDDLPEILTPYAKQQCAMVPEIKIARQSNSDYEFWTLRKPAIYDKEFFDTNSGAFAVASYLGLNPEFGVQIDPELQSFAGGKWIDKIKENNSEQMSVLRRQPRRA